MRVTDIIRDCGIVDTTYFTQEARDRGTAVHKAIALLEKGQLDPEWLRRADEKIQARMVGWMNWRQDMPHWQLLRQEFEVTHPRYGYVGHPDVLAHNTREEFQAVIDMKPPGESDWHGLQLAGYQAAIKASWGEMSMPGSATPPLRRFNLYLGSGLGRNYKLVPRTEPTDWNVFYAAYIVAKFKERK